MLDAGIVNVKLHALLGGAPLRPPEADARTNTMPATMMTEVAMMTALRFILHRHRSLFVLYGLSWAMPVGPRGARAPGCTEPGPGAPIIQFPAYSTSSCRAATVAPSQRTCRATVRARTATAGPKASRNASVRDS